MQLISLIFGGNWHICSPANLPFDDEHYGFWVLVEQIRRFGPFNDSFEEIADAERLAICTGAIVYTQENQKWLPFSVSEDDELARPDRDFIAKMMKLEPKGQTNGKGAFARCVVQSMMLLKELVAGRTLVERKGRWVLFPMFTFSSFCKTCSVEVEESWRCLGWTSISMCRFCPSSLWR